MATKDHAIVKIPGSVKTWFVSLRRDKVEGRYRRADGTLVFCSPTPAQRIAAIRAAQVAITEGRSLTDAA